MAKAFARFSALAVGVLSVVACSSNYETHTTPRAADAADAGDAGGLEVDTVEIVRGVPDRGRDPAVVAIDIGGEGLCSGTLIAPDVVLTARHCVSYTSEGVACPAQSKQISGNRSPHTLSILLGDDASTARLVARGKAIVVPKSDLLCDHDIAAIVLDEPVGGVAPVKIDKSPPVAGHYVRAVGFGKTGDDGEAGTKLLRDHVKIQDVGSAEFLVGEATCNGDSGGPALDSSSGELLGVVSRGGPACDGKDVHNIYTRADAFGEVIAAALEKASQGDSDPDAGLYSPPKDAGVTPKPTKPGSDMGEPCTRGADCSAGVCVKDGSSRYCSRTCGTGDRCPSGYHCTQVTSSTKVCVAAS